MSIAAVIHPRETSASVGRLVGVLLLAHLAGGLIVPFIMLHPLVTPPGFLVTRRESRLRCARRCCFSS
jgi:hypothetical protein